MKLADLSPRWVTKDLFVFQSPAGTGNWLAIKRAFMQPQDQVHAVFKTCPDIPIARLVTVSANAISTFSSDDFNSMTVSPSVGLWNIINGEVS